MKIIEENGKYHKANVWDFLKENAVAFVVIAVGIICFCLGFFKF